MTAILVSTCKLLYKNVVVSKGLLLHTELALYVQLWHQEYIEHCNDMLYIVDLYVEIKVYSLTIEQLLFSLIMLNGHL